MVLVMLAVVVLCKRISIFDVVVLGDEDLYYDQHLADVPLLERYFKTRHGSV